MKFSEEEAYWAAVRLNLYVFLVHAFNTIYPGKVFLDNWHIHAIAYYLELSIKGKQPRLIINLPPRQLKSFITSVVLPAFILGQNPSAKMHGTFDDRAHTNSLEVWGSQNRNWIAAVIGSLVTVAGFYLAVRASTKNETWTGKANRLLRRAA